MIVKVFLKDHLDCIVNDEVLHEIYQVNLLGFTSREDAVSGTEKIETTDCGRYPKAHSLQHLGAN